MFWKPRKYRYRFKPYVRERVHGMTPALYELVTLLDSHAELVATEKEFEEFQFSLSKVGVMLNYVVRVPYKTWERVG